LSAGLCPDPLGERSPRNSSCIKGAVLQWRKEGGKGMKGGEAKEWKGRAIPTPTKILVMASLMSKFSILFKITY